MLSEINNVCVFFNRTPAQVYERDENRRLKQKREWVEIRQVVHYYLWRKYKDARLMEIAKATHVHAHTYVIYSKKCVENRMATDKMFEEKINRLFNGKTK